MTKLDGSFCLKFAAPKFLLVLSLHALRDVLGGGGSVGSCGAQRGAAAMLGPQSIHGHWAGVEDSSIGRQFDSLDKIPPLIIIIQAVAHLESQARLRRNWQCSDHFMHFKQNDAAVDGDEQILLM